MSPLAAAPNRGFADWQRTLPYDTNKLDFLQNVNAGVSFGTQPYDVSRFLNVSGGIVPTAGQLLVQFDWYLDPATTIFAAERQVTYDAAGTQFTTMRLRNLGPFLKVNTTQLGGVQPVFNVLLFADNRDSPLDFIPHRIVSIHQEAAVIGAGASVQVYPFDFYSGPISVVANPALAGMRFALEYLSPAGTYDKIDEMDPPANAYTRAVMTAPVGQWRFNVTNPGAASTFSLYVTPSTTGAT